MWNLLKSVAKGGVTLFVVGTLLAYASPAIAEVVGMIAPSAAAAAATLAKDVAANALWNGAFFGAFGAINAAVCPVFDKMFGAETAQPVEAFSKSEQGTTPTINVQLDKEVSREVAASMSTAFRDRLKAERNAPSKCAQIF